jgi:hypothetical protein
MQAAYARRGVQLAMGERLAPHIADTSALLHRGVRAGKRVFQEFDIPAFRVFDPKLIAAVRTPEAFARDDVKPRPDGTLPDLRWVPTSRGLALSILNPKPPSLPKQPREAMSRQRFRLWYDLFCNV